MTELSSEERDLLRRIDARAESRPIFFQQLRGLKWFNALKERGFFDDHNNPRPKETTDDGHVLIPYWHVLDYLDRTSSELHESKNADYAISFREILVSVTQFAKNEKFSNYRTWWKFAEIISDIPIEYVKTVDLDTFDYWLDDPIDTSLVGEAIGTKWLPSLLDRSDDHAQELAIKLVSMLFRATPVFDSNSTFGSKAIKVRMQDFQCREIIEHIAQPLGNTLGSKVLPFFECQIDSALGFLDSDETSVIWRPAIEDDDQNLTLDNQIHTLIDVYRDTLSAFVENKPIESIEYLSSMLESQFYTIRRVAIHVIDKWFQSCKPLFDRLLDPTFWTTHHYKHELWTLINHHYRALDESQKNSVWDSIHSIDSNTSESEEQARAYRQAGWFAAIRKYGDREEQEYQKLVNLADSEPDHPSYEAYMQWGQVVPKSPITLEQLSSMETSDLINYLKDYREDKSNFFESPIEGLFETIRESVKSSPTTYSHQLQSFLHIDLKYIYQIVEAYRELWVERSSLPWTEVWESLLQFCYSLVSIEDFWNEKNAERVDAKIPNRHWVVGSVASLIETGVKSDNSEFDLEFLEVAEDIVRILLQHQKGEQFEANDAVFSAINSPRGKCINALINLTLRKCRDADSSNENDHSKVWRQHEPLYDRELELTSTRSLEVPTLFANYLPNFLYMSEDWTFENLDRIFSHEDHKWWTCAMEGYAYVSKFYETIYRYLRDAGHLIKVLDDDSIYHRARDRVITNICFAYYSGIESLESDSDLVTVLISRKKTEELNKLILELWRYGKSDKDLVLKVKEFWAKVISKIEMTVKGSQSVASHLCKLVELLDEVDESSLSLIREVAPYACVEHHSYDMFKWLEKLSASQPKESHLIWQSMIRFSSPSYPADSIKCLLKNNVNAGFLRPVREIVDTYVRRGNLEMHNWLMEIHEEKGDS